MSQFDPTLAPIMQQIFAASPLLSKYRNQYAVIRGRPMIAGDNRQLESYAPDESWNPIPGMATTELYNSLVSPQQQQQLITGDMLHHLATVDPQWAQMKAAVVPPEMQTDPQTYRSRGDEFLMGYITPDAQNDWMSHYTPQQKAQLERMKQYLYGNLR